MRSASIRRLRRIPLTWLAPLLALLGGCPTPEGGPGGEAGGISFADERGAALGPDASAIGGIRVSVETGVVNGAGTEKPVLVWFDNEPHEIGASPATDFRPGENAARVLRGPGLPRTLGALRRASILLTLQLGRAEIAASWYCERALVEVRLEGSEEWQAYLSRAPVGWLSQDEPPRRSTAYALQ